MNPEQGGLTYFVPTKKIATLLSMIPCTTLGVIFKSFKEILRTENSILIFEQIVKINIAI